MKMMDAKTLFDAFRSNDVTNSNTKKNLGSRVVKFILPFNSQKIKSQCQRKKDVQTIDRAKTDEIKNNCSPTKN